MEMEINLTKVKLKLEGLDISRLRKLDILQRTLKELKLQVLFQGLLVYL